MTSRTVAVRLTAEVGSYVTGVKNAARATKDLGRDVSREAVKNKQAWQEVGAGMLAFGAAAGAGVGLAVKRFADFDQAMSNVKAATHESARGMEQLRDAALEAGARTAFSASEAAEGIEALAKAGVSTSAILNGGLNGALDLAAAGGMAVGDAAEIAATALTQFSLEGAKVPHVADLLAAAAGKAQGDVSDMGMALKQAGLVASQTGLTIEETTAGLASFAAAGLIGSDAGTSFKSMLQRLTPQSAEAAGKMDELGISAYDAQGNFVGLEAFAGNLQTSLQGLTVEQRNSAMATIFGSDAVRAAAVLYSQGAEGVAEWTAKVNDAGYAQETAALRLDNLKGDLEALGGSFETALIGSGSAANGVLREMTQLATGAINVYSALPAPVQATATAAGALAAAVGLAGGAFLLAVPKVAAFKLALGDMGPRTQAIGRGLGGVVGLLGGPWGLALAGGVTALGIFGAAKANAKARVEEFTSAIERDSGAIGANARALAVRELEQSGALRTAEKYGVSLDLVTDAALGNARAMEELRNQAAGFRVAATQNVDTTSALGRELQGLVDVVDRTAAATEGGIAAAKRQSAALGEEADAAGPAADGLAEVGAAAIAAAPKVEELTDAQKRLAEALDSFVHPLGTYQGLLQEKEEAERKTAQATADATESAEDSWEDYAKGATVSLGEFAAALEEDNRAHAEWKQNLVKVAQTAGADVAMYLAEMGEDGVRLTAEFANGTAEETKRAAEAIRANMALGADGAERELEAMAAMGAAKGKKTADQIAREVGIGAERVAALAKQYGINLAAGLNPVLVALGRPGILAGTSGRARHEADGGVVDFYAKGGVRENHVAQIARAGEWRVWAEDETGGEAYIPLAPSKRQRSVNIWEETGRRLGVFAAGGFWTPDMVPAPPSTRPYGPPLSTAADGTMRTAYDAARAFATAQMEQGGTGGSAAGLLPVMAAARQYVMETYGIRNIGGFSRRNIAGTSKLSDHALGKAIDVMTSNGPLGWAIARDFAFGEAGRKFRAENVIWQQSISSRGGPFRGMADRGSATQNHRDHVHIDTYAKGGILNPHVRDGGGPLLPGFTFNGTGRPEMVLPMASGGVVGGRRGIVRAGQVNDVEWNRLIGAGWTGNPRDAMEAIYKPIGDVVKWGEVSRQYWNRLMADGWTGNAKDGMEALYRPLPMVSGGVLRTRPDLWGRKPGDKEYGAAAPSLTTLTRGMTDVGAIEAAIKRWNDYTEAVERAARKRELVADARTAVRLLNEAKAAETLTRKERDRAIGTDRLESAQRELRSAYDARLRAEDDLRSSNKAVRDFDAARRVELEREAVGRLIDKLQREAEVRRQLIDIRDEQKSRLDAMLDQERAARSKGLDAERDYAEKVTAIREKQAAAQQQLRTASRNAARDLQLEQQRILDARRQQLEGWARLDENAEVQWGYTVGQLLDNARSQAADFEEWMASLANARRRGVSEQVIASLGLDEGPAALGQLRQFGAATVGEIEALNTEVARRTALAGRQTSREQRNGYSNLGRELTAAQQRYAAALTDARQQFARAQADLAEEMTQAQSVLLTRQAEVALELAAIGRDQGRSLVESVAQGMRSALPQVVAEARALRAAMTNAAAAGARGPGQSVPGAPPRGTAGQVVVNGQTLSVNTAGIIVTKGSPYYGKYPAQVAAPTYANGGWASTPAAPTVNVTAPSTDLSVLVETNREISSKIERLQRYIATLPQKQSDLRYANTR